MNIGGDEVPPGGGGGGWFKMRDRENSLVLGFRLGIAGGEGIIFVALSV